MYLIILTFQINMETEMMTAEWQIFKINNLNFILHRHDFAGTDQFPIVFKISYGREILVR